MGRFGGTALLAQFVLAAVLAVAACGCGSTDIASPTSNLDVAKDEAMKAGLMALNTGIAAYIATTNAAPPIVDEATVGAYVNPWPVNPWTNEPMKPGSETGDYSYEVLGEREYSLVGHLSNGDYTLP